ncbi:MAG: hypothetical protein SH850_13890 [Planctomycetaceae bacterium]|nr:hypothetical protein [Planctomycetaceae bacterium]
MDEPDDDPLTDLFAPWRWKRATLAWVFVLVLLFHGIAMWLFYWTASAEHGSDPYTESPQSARALAKPADT